MKKESFRLDNGTISRKGNNEFIQLYLQFFSNEVTGIITDTSFEKVSLMQFFSGDASLTNGKIYWNETCINYNKIRKLFLTNVYISKIETQFNLSFKVYEYLYYSQFNPFVINQKKFKLKAATIFREFDINIDVNCPINQLSKTAFFYVDLIKSYINNKSLVIIPDISKSLAGEDFVKMKKFIDRLCLKNFSFVFIESFYNYVLDYTSRIFYIQNGSTVASLGSDDPELRKKLSGLQNPFKIKDKREIDLNQHVLHQNVLSIKHLFTDNLNDVELHIQDGQTSCIIYQDDSFLTDFIGIFKGRIRKKQGEIELCGKEINISSIKDLYKRRIGLIEEFPSLNIIFQTLPLIDSICTPLSDKVSFFWFRNKYKNSIAKYLENYIPKEYIYKKGKDVPVDIRHIAAFCRWLVFSPVLVICIKPFSHTDQHLNEITKQMVLALVKSGIAVLILTPILPSTFDIPCNLLYFKDGAIIS